MIEIDEKTYKYLLACKNTLNFIATTKALCPKCNKTIMVSGCVCFECGYDSSEVNI